MPAATLRENDDAAAAVDAFATRGAGFRDAPQQRAFYHSIRATRLQMLLCDATGRKGRQCAVHARVRDFDTRLNQILHALIFDSGAA